MGGCCNGGCVQTALAQRLIDNTHSMVYKIGHDIKPETKYVCVLNAVRKLLVDFPKCILSCEKTRKDCKTLCELIIEKFGYSHETFPLPGTLYCEVSCLYNLVTTAEPVLNS